MPHRRTTCERKLSWSADELIMKMNHIVSVLCLGLQFYKQLYIIGFTWLAQCLLGDKVDSRKYDFLKSMRPSYERTRGHNVKGAWSLISRVVCLGLSLLRPLAVC
jgi:hypothetical protein